MKMTRTEKNMFDNLFGIAQDIQAVDRSKHAAAVVRRGIPISIGINSYKTHAMQGRFGSKHSAYIHAETAAIKRASAKLNTNNLSDFTLIVVRSKFDKEHNHMLGNSKPCPVCSAVIKNYGINKVIYSIDNGFVKEKRYDSY